MACHGFGLMSGWPLEAQKMASPAGENRERPGMRSLGPRRAIYRPTRAVGNAVFTSTVAQIGGRDYSLVGATNQAEMGKIRYVGRFREWAVAAAIILAVFAGFSWNSPLYFVIFLVPSAAFAIVALILHFRRPVIEVEESEIKTGNSRRTATKYPPP